MAVVAALLDVLTDFAEVHGPVCGIWLRSALHVAPPRQWLAVQVEMWGLLQLELAHRKERQRCLRAGVTDYTAGLPHVNTMAKGAMSAMAAPVPPVRHLVFIGGGHAHAFVLKQLGMRPIPGVQVRQRCKQR